MDKNICNICGGNYIYKDGKWICACCDNIRQDEITNDELVLLSNAATKLRMADFDGAEELYLDFIKKYPKNSEGYWGLLLSKYGIKYEDDFDGKRIPTVYATSIESIINDEYYKKALALADKDREKYYKQQANKFELIRQEWVEKASKEQPVDIFICYKDSDEENDIARTDDSYEAQNLYTYLMSKGYSVFFSRESLRDKVSEKYEPYIFNALNTAHVMIVYSSSKEYIESTWVKNEWTRFLKKIKNKQKQPNSLIVAFDKMKSSELPKAFSSVQCMNASEKTFYADLEKHIQKVIKKATTPIAKLERVELKENVKHKKTKKLTKEIVKREIGTYSVEQLTGDDETQLKTAYKFLARGLFSDAEEIFNKILEKTNRNGQAIIGKLLVDLNATSVDNIAKHINEETDLDQFEDAIAFSDKEFALKILSGLKKSSIYHFNEGNYELAINLFEAIIKYNVEDTSYIEQINSIITDLIIQDKNDIANNLITLLLKTFTEDTDKYLTELERVIDIFRSQSEFTLAEKYIDMYMNIYKGNPKIVWKSILNGIGCNDEEKLADYIYNLEDFKTFEHLLQIAEDKNSIIDKVLNSIKDCVSLYSHLGVYTDCSRVFDAIIRYTADDKKYIDVIFDFAKICQEKGLFTLAEKYYAIVISEEETNHNAYWRLLQSKLKAKNNKELIEQPIIITTLSEFHSAIVATGDDERSADRYIDLKAKQLEYIENQKVLKAKKKHRKKVITIFTICFSIILAICAGLYGWNLYYKSQNRLLYILEDGTYTVKAGKYYDEKYITIPETYNGKLVTGIDDNAFKGKNIEVVKIPSSVIEIGSYAFYDCDLLTTIEFYSNSQTRVLSEISSIETIGDYAFYNCSSLENFEFSNNLTYLGKYAFANCSNLNEIVIPNSLENILDGTFKNAFNNVESISIPQAVEYIGKDAFNANITNILVDERNSIPTNWDSSWCKDSINVKWSMLLNFNYNGATANNTKSKISVVLGESFECPIPTKLGYSFAGWFYDVDDSNTQITGPDGMSINNWDETSSADVTAKWIANNNTIIFNGNGATSGEMDNQILATNSSDELNLNNYTRNGYTFAGWATTSNGEVEFEDNSIYTMGTNAVYNLYAIWEANTNTLIFNGNGPQTGNLQVWGTMTNMSLKTDEVVSLPENTFIRNGYRFLGWATTSNGEVEFLDKATYTMGANSSSTLYAKWQPINYTITLELTGGNYDGDTTISYNAESSTITIGEPTRKGYSFEGWYEDGVGGLRKTITISTGTIYNKTFTAKWIGNTNQIIYNGNGATSGSMENQLVKTGDTFYVLDCAFEKIGYNCIGWSSTPNGEAEYFKELPCVMGSNSVYTLYAVWEAKTNLIIFNGNGATSGEMPNQLAKTNETITLNENVFRKTGFGFIGWSTSPTGEVIYDNKDTYLMGENESYTLYAVWELGIMEIYSVDDLLQINSTLGENSEYSKYYLMNDIDLNNNSSFIGIGTKENHFIGEFDGNGYKIKNIKPLIDCYKNDNYICKSIGGVFNYTTNANIHDLVIENCDITITTGYSSENGEYDNGGIGILVGKATGGEISNITISNSSINLKTSNLGGTYLHIGGGIGYCSSEINKLNLHKVNIVIDPDYIQSAHRGVYVGGIIGSALYTEKTPISNISFEGTMNIKNAKTAGGIYNVENANLTNIDIKSNITSNSTVGGVINTLKESTLTNANITGEIVASAIREGSGSHINNTVGGIVATLIYSTVSISSAEVNITYQKMPNKFSAENDTNYRISLGVAYVGVHTKASQLSRIRTNGKININDLTSPYNDNIYIGGIVADIEQHARAGELPHLKDSWSSINVEAILPNHEGLIYVGGIVAKNKGQIERCYSIANLTTQSTKNIVAGAVAQNNEIISDCYSSGNVYARCTKNNNSCYAAGFVSHNTGTIINSFCDMSNISTNWTTTGSFYGYAGQFVTSNTGTIDNCYYSNSQTCISHSYGDGTVISNNVEGNSTDKNNFRNKEFVITSIKFGEFVSEDDLHVNPKNVWNFDNESLPMLNGACIVTFEANGGEGSMEPILVIQNTNKVIPECGMTKQYYTFKGWATSSDGEVVYENGSVIEIKQNLILYAVWEEKIKEIYTANDLLNIPNELDTYHNFKLMNNIDLDSINWVPIGTEENPFSGSFDGGNFTISNLNISREYKYIGLFGYVYNASISNLKVKNIDISFNTFSLGDAASIGGIVGYMKSDNLTISKVLNCEVEGHISIDSSTNTFHVGGIVGRTCGISTSMVNIDQTSSCVDIRLGTSNRVKAVHRGYAGGLVGLADYLNIVDSYYNSSIVLSGYYHATAGGLVGKAFSSSISNCFANASVFASVTADAYGGIDTFAGGVIGFSTSNNISNSFSVGNVVAVTPNYRDFGYTNYCGKITITNIEDDLSVINNCYSDVSISSATNKYKIDWGTSAIKNDILTFINSNWDSSVWNLSSTEYPTLK